MAQERLVRFPLQLPALRPIVEAAQRALQGANGVTHVEIELGDIEVQVFVAPDAFIVESLLAARLEAAGVALAGQEPEERPLAFANTEEAAPKAPPKPAFSKSLPILGQATTTAPKPANRQAMRWLSIPTREVKDKEAREIEAELLKLAGVSRAVIEAKLSRAVVRVRAGEVNRAALLAVTKGAALPVPQEPALITVPGLDDPGLADALERKLPGALANPASGLALCRERDKEGALLSAARSLFISAALRGTKPIPPPTAPAIGAFLALILLLSSLLSLGGNVLLPQPAKALLSIAVVLLVGGASFIQYQRADWLRWLAALGCAIASYFLPEGLFAESAALMALGFFINHEIEVSQRRRRTQPLVQLIQRIHVTARVEEQRDGNTLSRDNATPKIGDIVIVRAGERVPVDGSVVRGRAELSPFEALPSGPLRPGEYAFAGQEISSGEVSIKAVAIEENTFLGRLITGTEAARTTRPTAPSYLRFGKPVTLGLALLVGLVFMLQASSFVGGSLSVLLLLSLSSWRVGPAFGYASALAEAGRQGVRVKDTHSLVSLADAKTTLWDRSGALQREEWRVSDVAPLYNQPEENVVRYAASACNGTAHPFAEALVDYARSTEVSLPEAEMQDPVPGEGVLASVLGRAIYVGTALFLEENNISVEPVAEMIAPLEQEGKDIIYVAVDRRLIGFLAIENSPRKGLKDAISAIKKVGVKSVAVSGGTTIAVKALADFAGIDEVRANLPAHRRPWEAESLREDGQTVLAVGDAEKDAPLLQAATLSFGLSAYGDQPRWSFDSAKRDPEVVAKLLSLCHEVKHATQRTERLMFACYGAALFLLLLGFLPMPLAALFGSLMNTLSVVSNTKFNS